MDLTSQLFDCFEAEDDLGVVIRSHIIVEQYLNNLISSLLQSCSHFEKMDLDYSNTVKLAFALGLNPRLESSLNSLGTLRNDFAHRLRPSLSVGDVNNLYKSLDGTEKSIINSGVKKASEKLGFEQKKHKEMTPKQQYVNIAVVLCAALHKACQEIT